MLQLVEKLADIIENGTRDQQSDALVNPQVLIFFFVLPFLSMVKKKIRNLFLFAFSFKFGCFRCRISVCEVKVTSFYSYGCFILVLWFLKDQRFEQSL